MKPSDRTITVQRIAVSPEVLRWARKRAGLAVADLRPKFPHLAEWEAEADPLELVGSASLSEDQEAIDR